ncbi:MAG: 4-(cytidine 5'-diphospho)-2-C-methyl-D-erythritol kinase [Oceanococcus sp.]
MSVGLGAQARWPAPAKLNLFLHIVGRRADGRHNLQTVFQILDFGDELEFFLRDDEQISISPSLPGVELEQNLCVRAARALQRKIGKPHGVDIHCRKRIPMGGGLGGGSSDAATCLVALNQLWGIGLSIDELAEIGLTLGADVPVFVRGHSAFAEGVGEKLTPLELPEPWYCVVTPDCEVPTGTIFSAEELTRNTPPVTISDLLVHATGLRNDCWPVVASRFPAVRHAYESLSEFGQARMSGTGASVFVQCADRNSALQIASKMSANGQAFVAQGLNQSPLLLRANEQTTGV